MKLYIYALKNRLSGIFERPFAEIYDEEQYPELLSQSLAVAPVDALERHKEFDLYCLGQFDSKSGDIVSQPASFVITLEAICLQYLKAKEVKEDGRCEETRA